MNNKLYGPCFIRTGLVAWRKGKPYYYLATGNNADLHWQIWQTKTKFRSWSRPLNWSELSQQTQRNILALIQRDKAILTHAALSGYLAAQRCLSLIQKQP